MSNTELPTGPPWSLDVVADVHAGVYDPQDTRRLRALIADDPEASAMLAALDSVVDDLSLLPAPVMPAHVVARLDAALEAESQARDSRLTSAPVTPIRSLTSVDRSAPTGPAPSGSATPLPPSTPLPPGVGDLDRARRRRQGIFAAVGAVAAAAAIGTVVVLTLPGSTPGSGNPADAAPVAAEQGSTDLVRHFATLDNGISRAVPTADLTGCLGALDIPTDSVLGAAEGEWSGQDVVLIVTDDLGDAPTNTAQVRVVIVEADCSADGALILRDELADR